MCLFKLFIGPRLRSNNFTFKSYKFPLPLEWGLGGLGVLLSKLWLDIKQLIYLFNVFFYYIFSLEMDENLPKQRLDFTKMFHDLNKASLIDNK